MNRIKLKQISKQDRKRKGWNGQDKTGKEKKEK